MPITPKELVKLAAACRRAGIKTFKSGDIEFTLTDETPVSNYKKKALEFSTDENPTTDELSDDALLNWSVVDITRPEGQ